MNNFNCSFQSSSNWPSFYIESNSYSSILGITLYKCFVSNTYLFSISSNDDEKIATSILKLMNIIEIQNGKLNSFRAFGEFQNTKILIYDCVFIRNSIDTKFSVHNGLASFFNCLSDKDFKLNIDEDQNLVQWGEGCIKTNIITLKKLENFYDPSCFGEFKIKNNFLIDYLSLFKSFILLLLLIIGFLGLVKIYKEIQKREEENIDREIIGDTSSLMNH